MRAGSVSRKLGFVLALLTVAGTMFARSPSDISQLKGETRVHYKESNVKLELSSGTQLEKRAGELWSETHKSEPSFVAEALYIVPKKTQENQIEELSVIARSFSKMQGMKYISSEGKEEVLYPEVWTVENGQSKKAVPDKTSGPVDRQTFYMWQKDQSFGGSVYQVYMEKTDNQLLLSELNLNPLYLAIVKAVEAKNLQVTLVISDKGDDLSIYVLVKASVLKVPFIDNLVKSSFTSRLEAVANWFIRSYYES